MAIFIRHEVTMSNVCQNRVCDASTFILIRLPRCREPQGSNKTGSAAASELNERLEHRVAVLLTDCAVSKRGGHGVSSGARCALTRCH